MSTCTAQGRVHPPSRPRAPLEGAPGEPWRVAGGGLGPGLEQDGVASLGDLLLGGLEVGDEGVEQARGDLLLAPIRCHHQITPTNNTRRGQTENSV